MDSIERTIVVNVPVSVASEPWLHVEGWPKFLKAIREVRPIDEKQFRIFIDRGGQEFESVAEISLTIPERRLAWRNVSGIDNSGVASFEALPDGTTQVNLKMRYTPDEGQHRPEVL